MKTHRDLDVYKDSLYFVIQTYKITSSFPKAEIFGLGNQLRRAAVSVPANIAEGAARKSSKEFVRFLYISFGSLSEIETLITIGRELNLISTSEFENLMGRVIKLSAQLSGLIKSISKYQHPSVSP